MVFGFLRGGKVQVHVEWPQDRVYRPGDTIPARVHLRMQGRPRVRKVRVGLVFWQRFRFPDWYEQEDGTVEYFMDWKEQERWVVQAELPLPQPLPKDFQKTYTGTLTIPEGVPPPHEGRICQGRWFVKTVVDRPLRPDDVYQAPLQMVVPPPGAFQQPDFYGQSTHPDIVTMRLHLPGLEFVEGDLLEGTLSLRAHREFQARSLRVTLDVEERIVYKFDVMPGLTFEDEFEDILEESRDTSRVADMELAAPFQMAAGEERRFPFRLQIPRMRKPTCQACGEGGTIRWTLQGVVDRPWKQDFRVVQEIFVYNGR